MLLRHTAIQTGNVTAPHSDEGSQCYCATQRYRQALLLRHTVMKAGNVTAPHSTYFPVHSCITATVRRRGALGRRDGTQHAAGEPQILYTDSFHGRQCTCYNNNKHSAVPCRSKLWTFGGRCNTDLGYSPWRV